MKTRDLAALALVLVAVGIERTASFGTNTMVVSTLTHAEEGTLALGSLLAVYQVLRWTGMLVGGVVALQIGPRSTAVLGALVAASGYLAARAGAPLPTSYLVAAFGVGVVYPCPVVVAAEVLAWDDRSRSAPPPHRFAAVAAFAVAVTVVSIGGSLLDALLSSHVEKGIVSRAAGALLLLSAALFAGAAVLGALSERAAAKPAAGPYREAAALPTYGAAPGRPARATLGKLFGVQAVYLVGASLTTPSPALLGSVGMSLRQSLFMLLPIVGLVASLVVFVVLLVAALQRWTVPPLLFFGASFLVFAGGAVPIAVSGSSVAIYACGAILTGAAMAACTAVPLAYAAIAVRGRGAALVIAVWTASGGVVSGIGGAVGAVPAFRPLLLGLVALLCLGAGVAILRFGRAWHRDFEAGMR